MKRINNGASKPRVTKLRKYSFHVIVKAAQKYVVRSFAIISSNERRKSLKSRPFRRYFTSLSLSNVVSKILKYCFETKNDQKFFRSESVFYVEVPSVNYCKLISIKLAQFLLNASKSDSAQLKK